MTLSPPRIPAENRHKTTDSRPAPPPDEGSGSHESSLLRPDETCRRIARADTARVLIDNQAYFAAVRQALKSARHSILIVGWHFDPRTRLTPHAPEHNEPVSGYAAADDELDDLPDQIGPLLDCLTRRRPGLDVHILVWDMALPIVLPRSAAPHRAKWWFRSSLCRFELDRAPRGACHHEKLLVIDDRIAFCSGGDFTTNRWDSPHHHDDDPRRLRADGKQADPRHEVTLMVEGEAASALGEVARMRWRECGKAAPLPPPSGRAAAPQTTPAATAEPSPAEPAPNDPQVSAAAAAAQPNPLHGVRAGIVLSRPMVGRASALRDGLSLHLATIEAARDYLYLENQYFTCPDIAAALAQRLQEPDGPEIVLVGASQSSGFVSEQLMERMRGPLLDLLRANDRHGRLRTIGPFTSGGRPIVVHSKVTIADDRLLRIGSMNLSSRSFGLDTECDVAIDAAGHDDDATRRAIRGVRDTLLAHFIGCGRESFAEIAARYGMATAIDRLAPAGQRVAELGPSPGNRLTRIVSDYQIGDPHGMSDLLRPWKRRRKRRAVLDDALRGCTTSGASRPNGASPDKSPTQSVS